VQSDVQKQGAYYASLRCALLRRGDPAALHHTRRQPSADHTPSGEGAELAENEAVIEVVERSLKISVEYPLASRVFCP